MDESVARRQTLRDVYYRAHPTRRDYKFTFRWVHDSWRVYIENPPNYRSRPTSQVATHRLTDRHGDYICWTTPLVTLSAAQGVAALWADSTENYIATGRFQPAPNRPAIVDRSYLADKFPRQTAGPAPQRPAGQIARFMQSLREDLL